MYFYLINSKKEVYITGWVLNLDIKLHKNFTLQQILIDLAKKGIHIYILLWNETLLANLKLKTKSTIQYLKKIKNIHCISHPNNFPILLTHHQKALIIDQKIAFIGGLDLAYGRMDDRCHVITDINSSNSCICSGANEDDSKESENVHFNEYLNLGCFDNLSNINHKLKYFKNNFPRQPWHDVHCCVFNELAKDITLNFIQRWNFCKKIQELYLSDFNNEEDTLDFENNNNTDPQYNIKNNNTITNNNNKTYTCQGQIIRSICPWSCGLPNEHSIYSAYLNCIENANHYIYIENQFFIGSTADNGTHNLIPLFLTKKIIEKMKRKEKFKVFINLPNHPEGDIRFESLQQIMKYCYLTINRNVNSIFQLIKKEFPNITQKEIEEYICFLSLRNYGILPYHKENKENKKSFVTEQIYVHSKIMLIDDKITIIGSANINDRSMLGNRDSEIGIVINDTEFIESKMNGKEYKAGKITFNLRMNLWKEHLGLLEEQINERNHLINYFNRYYKMALINDSNDSNDKLYGEPPTPTFSISLERDKKRTNEMMNQLIDPIHDNTFQLIYNIATKNTEIYEKVFPNKVLSERYKTIKDYVRERDNDKKFGCKLSIMEQFKLLLQIQGNLCKFPVDFARDEKYRKSLKLLFIDDILYR
ncbi:hypothetical protein ABK040_005356 [Willaertia magna]